jgi:FLVCR family MFS transporter
MTSQTMRLVYNITADTTDLFINYGNIFFLALALPFMYVIDKYGCRTAVMFGCVAVFACNLIRCFANNATTMSIWILHASFILNSIVGPVAQAVPSKLAEEWFPPEERTTATAVGALGNQCGTVLLDLLLPFVVPDDTSTSVADATHQQLMLNIILTAMSGLPLLMALIYFPNRPEHSPSASAELAREDQELVCFNSYLIFHNPFSIHSATFPGRFHLVLCCEVWVCCCALARMS